MANTSKISVKPYIYTHKKEGVGHSFTSKDSSSEKVLYPLYYQVVYKRQNTKMKSFYSGYYENLEDVQKNSPGLIEFETSIIKEAIQYESIHSEDYFQMKGFPERFNKYVRSTSQIIELYLKDKIRLGVMRTSAKKEYLDKYFNYFLFINYNDPKLHFKHLYNLFKKVYTDFDQFLNEEDLQTIKAYEYFEQIIKPGKGYTFTTIIDWHTLSSKNKFRDQLINNFKLDALQAELYVERIENAIQKELNR
jgi:hypothetical protein